MIEGGCKECLAIAVATTVKECFVRVTYILLSTSKFLASVINYILDIRLLYEIKDELQFVKLVYAFLGAYTVDILHNLCACREMLGISI